ncbi:hypothetical protein Salat_2398300 [Sesamum alatum]|uniref:Uncharacterized protein n=1 Tax=Sesamum alatum TaxID=300844 RepID=A0AAE2CF48_9LAMI|nr:hypothetical protein Salat_2398300 [Sesamum alatum]
MERVFVSSLIRDVEYGIVSHEQPHEDSIRNAIRMVNRSYGGRLSFTFGLCRWYQLKERHATFSWLINRDGVRWLPTPKLLMINEALWDEIAREKPFARAYHWDFEPLWTELKIIFESPSNEYADAFDDELYTATPPTPDETVVLVNNDEDDSSYVNNE